MESATANITEQGVGSEMEQEVANKTEPGVAINAEQGTVDKEEVELNSTGNMEEKRPINNNEVIDDYSDTSSSSTTSSSTSTASCYSSCNSDLGEFRDSSDCSSYYEDYNGHFCICLDLICDCSPSMLLRRRTSLGDLTEAFAQMYSLNEELEEDQKP